MKRTIDRHCLSPRATMGGRRHLERRAERARLNSLNPPTQRPFPRNLDCCSERGGRSRVEGVVRVRQGASLIRKSVQAQPWGGAGPVRARYLALGAAWAAGCRPLLGGLIRLNTHTQHSHSQITNSAPHVLRVVFYRVGSGTGKQMIAAPIEPKASKVAQALAIAFVGFLVVISVWELFAIRF